jgi:hypothetical protein
MTLAKAASFNQSDGLLSCGDLRHETRSHGLGTLLEGDPLLIHTA